jgi:phage-related protein
MAGIGLKLEIDGDKMGQMVISKVERVVVCMMNYIVWNGENSRSLTGLIIQELPPISKPAMRTEITQIDGKDGDISDFLGYGTYEKSVQIGLFGDYDINAIAKYFTGSGQVIFSNEPDKYYNAEITEQIDFERLVKFRKAEVVFRAQPYKYLVGEQPVSLEITEETSLTVTNTGLEPSKPIITLTGSEIVKISINGLAQFQINIDESYVTVDSTLEEAYKDNTQTLKNRQMIGVFPTLNPGENTITWTGSLTKISVLPMSRWL